MGRDTKGSRRGLLWGSNPTLAWMKGRESYTEARTVAMLHFESRWGQRFQDLLSLLNATNFVMELRHK
jgi:hypothetical protein